MAIDNTEDMQQDNPVDVFDISGTKPVLGTIPADEVPAAVQSGKYTLPKGDVDVLNPDGTPGTIPADQLPQALEQGYSYQSPREAKYSTTGQQVAAGLEGLGQGLLGPVAAALERMAGISDEDIRGREEFNPATHTGSELVGFGAGMFIPGSQAALIGKVGSKAAAALNVAKEASLASKAAKAAAQMAAETALMETSTQTSRAILEDPSFSVANATANIGLSGLLGAGLGGAGRAVFGGVESLAKLAISKSEALQKGADFIKVAPYRKEWDSLQSELRDTLEEYGATSVDDLSRIGASKEYELESWLSEFQGRELPVNVSATVEALKRETSHIDGTLSKAKDFYNKVQSFTSGARQAGEEGAVQGQSPAETGRKVVRELEAGAEGSLSKEASSFLSEIKAAVSGPNLIKDIGAVIKSDLAKIAQSELPAVYRKAADVAAGKSGSMQALQEAVTKVESTAASTKNLSDSMATIDKMFSTEELQKAFESKAGKTLSDGTKTAIRYGAAALGLDLYGPLGAAIAAGGSEMLSKITEPLLKRLANGENVGTALSMLASANAYGEALAGHKAVVSASKKVFANMASQEQHKPVSIPRSDVKHIEQAVSAYKQDPFAVVDKISDRDINSVEPRLGAAIGDTSVRALEYLSSKQPVARNAALPLDEDRSISKLDKLKWEATLAIAAKPLSVLSKINAGTLTQQDVTDLRSMFPGVYSLVAENLVEELLDTKIKEKLIPNKTKVGLTTFLGFPVDSTFIPQNMLTTQVALSPAGVPQGELQQGSMGTPQRKYAMGAMKDTASLEATPDQARQMKRQVK